jgi:O-methyltransferase
MLQRRARLMSRLERMVRQFIGRRLLSKISREVLDARLTYLSIRKLMTIEKLMRRIDRSKVPGDVFECGVALGGSAIVLASLMTADRCMYCFDVFGMIPPPSDSDPKVVHRRYQVISDGSAGGIGGDVYYGYLDNLYDRVAANFKRFRQPVDGRRIVLKRGLFEDTLNPTAPVALAHIDSDWHDPVRLCLERIWPALSIGGYIVLDDYNDYPGCRIAVDEFVRRTPEANVVQTAPNAVIQKMSRAKIGRS